ncbi:MAG TPA: hypothetical protein P5091_04675, partial [Acholeplasmataceae bacterium]|nr:hypothetical protein [Acholeplasmataceae bacterium]
MNKNWKSIKKIGYKAAILIGVSFGIGFLFSYLVYLGYWYRFVDGIKSLSWYDYPLWFFLTFYITLI